MNGPQEDFTPPRHQDFRDHNWVREINPVDLEDRFTAGDAISDRQNHGKFWVRPMHTDEPSQYPWSPMPHASDDHLAIPLLPVMYRSADDASVDES